MRARRPRRFAFRPALEPLSRRLAPSGGLSLDPDAPLSDSGANGSGLILVTAAPGSGPESRPTEPQPLD